MTATTLTRTTSRCQAQQVLHQISDPDLKAWLTAVIDGTSEPFLTPFEVQIEVKQRLGLDLRAPNLRRHRRRLTLTGEFCTCPQ